jgi:septal ring factor EnvC (AmiA/AmiB activator)
MNKNNIILYGFLVVLTAFILLGVKFLANYPVDWNLLIGATAVVLPLILQFCSHIVNKQKESQERIDRLQDTISRISDLEVGIKRINQIINVIEAIESKLATFEQENRRQERMIARLEAITETIVQQEQLSARVDRLSESIAKFQSVSVDE